MRVALFTFIMLTLAQCGISQQLANDTVHADGTRFESEPSIVAMRDTNGVIHVAAMFKYYATVPPYNSVGQIAHVYSGDSGKTWVDLDTFAHALAARNDPSIACDVKRGYMYGTFISDSARWLARSTDYGQTWSSTGPQLPRALFNCDANVIAVDNDPSSSYNGNIYIASGPSNGIVVVRSTDQGATYDTTVTNLNNHLGHDLAQLCVGKGGVLYLVSGDGIFNYSTDAGVTWNEGTNGVAGKQLFVPAVNEEGSGIFVNTFGHKYISMACQPTSDTVYFAYEVNNAIEFGYTADSGTTFHDSTTVSIPGLTVCEPWIAVDKNNNLYIAYYGEIDSIANVYVAISTDHGAHWSLQTQYVASNTYSMNNDFSQNGTGDYLSISALDAAHVYVMWCFLTNGQYQAYTATLNTKNVQYRNALGGVYSARHLILDASGANDTVASLAMVNYSSSGSHTAQPDSSKFHNIIYPHSDNFRFTNWNGSTIPSDTGLIHSFSVTANALGVQEADFENIDTLRVVNNCDGLIDHGTAGLKDVHSSSWQTGTSPVLTDTALRTHKYLADTTVRTITISSVNFNFEQWANGDTNLARRDSITTQGDTTIQAYFHANMRADAALNWNNQRKITYDSIGSFRARYWFAYVSHGNVYLTRSTDVTATPAGCKWDTARMVNTNYGHATNPAITWLPYQSDLNNPPRVVVVWEDTSVTGGAVYRTVRYSIYDTTGIVTAQSNVALTSASIASDTPAAPMVCPILPSDSTFKHYGDAVVVWGDAQKDSLMIAIINPQSVPSGPIGVPNSVGGEFGAIEPGYNRKDTATLSDPADFELTWHDSSGIKYSYLLLNTISYTRSANHIFQYTSPEQIADTTWWGVNEHASLAVNTSAEPLVAWEQIGSRMMPVNCPASPGTVCMTDNFIGRMGITLRSKVRHDSSWGGFISIVKFSTFPLTAGILNNSIYSSICDGAESFFAPSVTAYKDETGLCRLYWTHGLPGSCGGDSIHYKTLAFNGTGSSYINPDTTVSTSNGRTPTQPYSHWLPKAEHRTIWAQDSSTTEIMKRDGSCTVADNYVATSINDYNQACVHWNDTSNFSFVSGEYAMIDSAGSVTAMHQQPLSLTTAIHSINDAANQMRSQYFHIKNDTVKLICYNGVVLTDTTKSLHALGSTGGITFVVELRDSATGNLLQTLVPLGITHTFTSTSSPLGMDTVKVAGQSGKTCYFRLTVDTVGAPSTFSVTPSQVYSENLLSGVIAGDTGALGKEIARTAPVPENAVPLLSAYPNPFTAVGHVTFTLSQSMPATITLYDMMGRMVKQLAINQYFTAGNNTLTFNAANLPSGIYLCVFTSANTQAEKLMILEK